MLGKGRSLQGVCGGWGGFDRVLVLYQPSITASVGAKLARDGGLVADLFLPVVLRSNCGSEPARDGGLTAGQDFVDRVHIHFCGNGHLGFRPDGGSLLRSAKVTKTLLPHHSAMPAFGQRG